MSYVIKIAAYEIPHVISLKCPCVAWFSAFFQLISRFGSEIGPPKSPLNEEQCGAPKDSQVGANNSNNYGLWYANN